ADVLLASNQIVLRNPAASMTIKGGAMSGILTTGNSAGKITTLAITAQMGSGFQLGDMATIGSILVTSSSGNLPLAPELTIQPGATNLAGASLTLTTIGSGDILVGAGASLLSPSNITLRTLFGNITDSGGQYTAGGIVKLTTQDGAISLSSANI